jgi:membrane glycosyltransferase
MLLSIPYTVYTSRLNLGRAARRCGLLLTPEETSPPPELAAVAAAQPLFTLSEARPERAGEPDPRAVPAAAQAAARNPAVPNYLRMNTPPAQHHANRS